MLAVQTTRAGQIIGLSSESSGGLMVHGGLAEKEGDGLILAGPGGAGKTTVSERLQSPWRSLSDDAALVVRDTSGQYWGHPWPTWSRFMFGGPGGCWDVHQAVPLRRIVFLCRSSWDGLEPVSQGRASVLLAESAEQAGGSVLRRIQPDEARATRLRRFEAASCIARRIPCYQLHLSPNGNFERVIGSLW
jgi:SynChlorMet cassette protein ScmC